MLNLKPAHLLCLVFLLVAEVIEKKLEKLEFVGMKGIIGGRQRRIPFVVHALFLCKNQMAETTPTWNREKVKKVLEVLRELKDFERVPLPMEIHKAFDIPLNKPRNENVMTYFENYMKIQSMPVDSVEVIDGTKVHKEVKFPTSILEPFKLPEEFQPEGQQVIVHAPEEKVFSDEVTKAALKDETDA